jgi:hypothetical protein
MALKAAVEPFARLVLGGLTLTLETVALTALTVTAAVPLFVVSIVDVAITIKPVALSSAATARTPPALIAVPALPPLTNQVTDCAGLLVPSTMALKAAVEPFATFAVGGFTLTEVTVALTALTAIGAVPLFEASTVEVALTVKDDAPSSAATAKTPLALTIVPALPPPSTDQVTVCAGLPVPSTVAVKVTVPPFATLAVGGLTLTRVTVAPSGGATDGDSGFAP